MMTPGEVHFLSAFVGHTLSNPQDRFVPPKADRLNKMKWSSNCAHFKANFDFIGLIFCCYVAPRQQQDFAVLSDLGPLMQRQVATIGKQVLPAAFVIVHMRTRGSRTRRLEVSAFAKANPRPPHESNVTG